MWGELASPFLTQTNFLMLTLLPALECLLWLGYLQAVGGCQLRNLLGVHSLGIFLFLNSSVKGLVSGVYVVTLLVFGMGAELATTHTLYLLVGISFLLLSLAFVPLLTGGLVLGWVGLD